MSTINNSIGNSSDTVEYSWFMVDNGLSNGWKNVIRYSDWTLVGLSFSMMTMASVVEVVVVAIVVESSMAEALQQTRLFIIVLDVIGGLGEGDDDDDDEDESIHCRCTYPRFSSIQRDPCLPSSRSMPSSQPRHRIITMARGPMCT